MKRWKSLWLCMVFVLLFCTVLAAPAPVEDAGGKDTPYFTGMKDYFIQEDSQDNSDLDSYEFVTKAGNVTVEGRKYFAQYTISEDYSPVSELEIIRKYSKEVLERGGQVLFDGNKDGLRVSTMKYTKDAATIWVEVAPWDEGEHYSLTIIVENKQ